MHGGGAVTMSTGASSRSKIQHMQKHIGVLARPCSPTHTCASARCMPCASASVAAVASAAKHTLSPTSRCTGIPTTTLNTPTRCRSDSSILLSCTKHSSSRSAGSTRASSLLPRAPHRAPPLPGPNSIPWAPAWESILTSTSAVMGVCCIHAHTCSTPHSAVLGSASAAKQCCSTVTPP